MKKPAAKPSGKAARDIAFLTNNLHTLKDQLKRIKEQQRLEEHIRHLPDRWRNFFERMRQPAVKEDK